MARRRTRGLKRILPIEERAYYTRDEVCRRFGLSAKRLKLLIEEDETLPVYMNGRTQLFPKMPIDMWFEKAGRSRLAILDRWQTH
jgi:hypothetical protein